MKLHCVAVDCDERVGFRIIKCIEGCPGGSQACADGPAPARHKPRDEEELRASEPRAPTYVEPPTGPVWVGSLPTALDPPQATVSVRCPLIKDPKMSTVVDRYIGKKEAALRACYEAALRESPPSPSRVTLSFAVEKGTPAWITVKSAPRVSSTVTACASFVLSHWTGMFPRKGNYPESQELEITFERLPLPATAAAAPPGAGAGGSRR